jgi:hypothetical protein
MAKKPMKKEAEAALAEVERLWRGGERARALSVARRAELELTSEMAAYAARVN